jgi:mRNA-degrading endonuclease RelE of RelBE toxin-antitoxin system
VIEVRLSSHARKSFRRLARSDRRLFERVDRALDRLSDDPAAGKPLAGPLAGHRSLRVGSIRIVYRLDEDVPAVLVLDITQRGAAYR